jgi:hypothetical protein
MNAWIDCLTSIDETGDIMTSIHAPPGGVLVLQLDPVDDFAARCPELYATIIECAAFVNWTFMMRFWIRLSRRRANRSDSFITG